MFYPFLRPQILNAVLESMERRYLLSSAALVADPCDHPSGTMLLAVNGDDGVADSINITRQRVGKNVSLVVTDNGQQIGSFPQSAVSRIVVHGGSGDDVLNIDSSITLRLWQYGDADNDVLTGGGGPSILLGGDGVDSITGGSARDILIGGTGADRLVSNGADDILVAGYTDYDSDDSNGLAMHVMALCKIQMEWTNTTHNYATRVANIRGDSNSGDNSGSYLNGASSMFSPLPTAHDDGAADTLTGSTGQDWFFANTSPGQDTVTDQHPNESLEPLA